MKPKAILFDFDGVIGKTMEDNYQAWAKAFTTVNIEMDKKDYFLHEGLNPKHVAIRELQKKNISLSKVEEIVKLKEQYYLESNNFSFYPSVCEIIVSLGKRFKLGVVTGASYQRLMNTVSQDFLANFGSIISGDKVINPKPSPDPYLLAADELNVIPDECIVIENAPLGIKAAKSANMICVAICSTLEKKHLLMADFIIENISELERIVKKIVKRHMDENKKLPKLC